MEVGGGTGISPPDKSPPGQKTPRTVLVFVLVFVFVIVFVPSGDIFYCSGSRQLNHSSFSFLLFLKHDFNSCFYCFCLSHFSIHRLFIS